MRATPQTNRSPVKHRDRRRRRPRPARHGSRSRQGVRAGRAAPPRVIGRALDAADEQLITMQQRDAAVFGGGFGGRMFMGPAFYRGAPVSLRPRLSPQRHRQGAGKTATTCGGRYPDAGLPSAPALQLAPIPRGRRRARRVAHVAAQVAALLLAHAPALARAPRALALVAQVSRHSCRSSAPAGYLAMRLLPLHRR